MLKSRQTVRPSVRKNAAYQPAGVGGFSTTPQTAWVTAL
jgi:hypothetical protein